MWDPAHRNPLDKPAYKTASAQQTPSQGYWIDSRGVRHYGQLPAGGLAVGRAKLAAESRESSLGEPEPGKPVVSSQ